MDFAIVELKYVEKRMFIVPIKNIQSSKPKASAVDAYFCYISMDLTEEPNFNAKYCEKFDGSPGLFRVFIKKITKTYEEAVIFLKEKRMQVVPQKYRQPSNTDTELKTAAAKKKRVQNQLLKSNKKTASTKNSSHLTELLSAADTGSLTIASKFEDLVKRTLEDISNSDSSDIDSSTEHSTQIVNKSTASVSSSIENATYFHESDIHENQGGPIETGTEVASPASSSAGVDRHSLGHRKSPNQKLLQQLDQNEQSNASNNNLQKNMKFYNSSEVQMLTLPMSNETVKINQMIMKTKNPVAIVRKPKMTSALKLPLSANPVGASKSLASTPTILSKLNKNEVRKSPKGVLQLSEISNKQTVTSAVDDVVKTVSNEILSTSNYSENVNRTNMKLKDLKATVGKPTSGSQPCLFVGTNNGKRKIDTRDEVFTAVQKPKIDAPAPKVILNVSEVININEMIKQKETLEIDYSDLKKENETLQERNVALQSALVIASKSAAQVPFEAEEGGRRYRDDAKNVFLNTVQCNILDAIDDHRAYLNSLILAVFGSETLKKSSVTGRPSNRTKGPSKEALDPTKLKFIYDIMATRTNNSTSYTRSKVNKIINRKIGNLCAVGKPRSKKKKKKEDISDSDETTVNRVNNAGSQDSLNASELANEFVNIIDESHEHSITPETDNSPGTDNPPRIDNSPEIDNSPGTDNLPETDDSSEPSQSSAPADPLNYYNGSSFINNGNNLADDCLMFDINDLDLDLIDQSAFENTNCMFYIENGESQPGN